MYRTLNAKLLLGMLAAVVLVGIGVHFLHAFQAKRNASAWLQLASREEERGRLDLEARYLGRYVSYVRDDVEALARLGQVLVKLGTPRSLLRALEIFEEALRLQPERHDVRRQLVHLAIDELGRYADASAHLEILQAAFPQEAELEVLRGRCEQATAQYGQARVWYEKAIEDSPQQVRAHVLLASLLRDHLNQPQKADQVMEDLVKANDGSFTAHLERADYLALRTRLLKLGSPEERRQADRLLPSAGNDIERALELAPAEADVLYAAANWALEDDRGGPSDPAAARASGLRRSSTDGRRHSVAGP